MSHFGYTSSRVHSGQQCCKDERDGRVYEAPLAHRKELSRFASAGCGKPHRANSPYNGPWRPRGQVDIYLYSSFNLGSRWGWVVNVTPRPLYPREWELVPIVQEAGWVSGPVGTLAVNTLVFSLYLIRTWFVVLIVLHFAFCLYLKHTTQCPWWDSNPQSQKASGHRPLSPDRPARNESLYRRRYPGPSLSANIQTKAAVEYFNSLRFREVIGSNFGTKAFILT